MFPHIPCGWLGLGGGSQAWINQAASNLVVGHELGHCFGMGHSSSLDCGTLVVGGTCTISEYGDPFSIMGNSNARHFPASMKNQLGYFPPGTLATHASGSQTYTLSPIEVAGGPLYAVKVPIAETQRTYWLEYRRPIGFDSSMSGNTINGALMRLGPGYPTYSCNTCLLDMTPTDGGFGNAALEVGQTYFDAESEMRVTPLSADASSLVVQVEIGAAPPFAVDRHANPSNSFPNGVLENGEVGTIEPSWLNGGGAPAAMTGSGSAFTGPGRGRHLHDLGRLLGLRHGPGGGARLLLRRDGRLLHGHGVRPDSPGAALGRHLRRDPRRRDRSLLADPPRPELLGRAVLARRLPLRRNGAAQGAHVRLRRNALLSREPDLARADGRPSPPGRARRGLRAAAGDRRGLRRRARERIRRGVDRAPRGRRHHGGLRKRCELLPELPVTRAQMAVFILKTEHGSAWTPPAASGDFTDVPIANPFAPWVEALKDEGVTAGCGVNVFCPTSPTKRGQMAVFLTKAFALALYGP